MLIDDLSDWPTDAWLAIDDYHFAMESRAAEQFIRTFATQSSIRFLLTSRRRPPWVSARSRLYGESVELGRSDLAMNIEEATLVLEGRQGTSDLVSRAGGWPAVIGLAALTEPRSAPADQMPSALHEFLAGGALSRCGRGDSRRSRAAVCVGDGHGAACKVPAGCSRRRSSGDFGPARSSYSLWIGVSVPSAPASFSPTETSGTRQGLRRQHRQICREVPNR